MSSSSSNKGADSVTDQYRTAYCIHVFKQMWVYTFAELRSSQSLRRQVAVVLKIFRNISQKII